MEFSSQHRVFSRSIQPPQLFFCLFFCMSRRQPIVRRVSGFTATRSTRPPLKRPPWVALDAPDIPPEELPVVERPLRELPIWSGLLNGAENFSCSPVLEAVPPGSMEQVAACHQWYPPGSLKICRSALVVINEVIQA